DSALQRRGHQVALHAKTSSGKQENAWRELFGNNLFFYDDTVLDVIRRRFATDAIYVHKWDHLASIETWLNGAAPLVRMVHDHDIYCLRSYRYNPLTRRICTRAAGAHCVFPCLAPIKRNRGAGLPIRWASFFEKQREIA